MAKKFDGKITWTNKDKVLSFVDKVGKNLSSEIKEVVSDIMWHRVLPDAMRNVNRKFKQGSGKLRRALGVDTKLTADRVTASIFADLRIAPYARIQELGGTIKPKNAKSLAIPIFGTKGSPRRKTGLFVFKSPKTGKVYLAKLVGAKKKLKVMYVLKKQVVIKSRPFLAPALTKNVNRISRAIKKLNEASFK